MASTVAAMGGSLASAASADQVLVKAPMRVIETDVLVCGGGCAGTAAALSAARKGAKTLLVEKAPFAGGIITSVGLPYFDGIADIDASGGGAWDRVGVAGKDGRVQAGRAGDPTAQSHHSKHL